MLCSWLRRLMFAAVVCLCSVSAVWAETAADLRVATFRCDITPPLGQPMISCDPAWHGGTAAAGQGDRAGGRTGSGTCSAPWIGASCATDRYDALRSKIAAAAGTEPCPRGRANRPSAHRARWSTATPRSCWPKSASATAAPRSEGLRRDRGTSGGGGEAVARAASSRSIRSARARPRSIAWRPAAGCAGRDGQDSRPL